MKWQTFALILVSVSLSALAQIALKHGMSSATAQRALEQGGLAGALAIGTNLHVILGFAMYGLGAVLWLGVLAKVDVGQAYPFVGLGFIMTMCFGIWILH